jgi:ubiquinone/menaquinone biosynthesis C-methylase UbiE
VPNDQSQEKIFLTSEGDRYFERNRVERSFPSPNNWMVYGKYLKKGFKVLEIGCSYGSNLKAFSELRPCEGYGIDPSRKAIQFGKKTFPSLHLSVGTAEHLDFPDNFFDFVIFGFCLYLVDRRYLARVVAEADRVLKSKGFLGITDFDSKTPKRRAYKHCSGVRSYKMSYQDLFLAFPHFSLVEKHAFSHASDSFVQDVKERLCSVVLFKDHQSGYFEEKDQ